LAALAVALAGCGNVTSGGVGEVEVILAPDELTDLVSNTPSLQASVVSLAPGDSIEGTLRVHVRSFARRPGGTFEELTDGVQEITVSLGEPEPIEIARRELSAGRYEAVRVSLGEPEPIEIARRELSAGRYEAVRTFFGRIEVEVTSGLVVDGVPVDGTVIVDLDALGTLSVVDFTAFEVWEGAPTVIALEMQTRLWLRLVDAVTHRVDVTDFRRIFRLRIQQGTT
jgi:hypothetical protein